MNFFHELFKSKLDSMRAAAPRASIHLLHESNGFSIYLDEATTMRKVTQLGTLTDHAEDILEETVPVLFIPLEQCVRFVEEVTAFHSVGLVDVILADKVHAARYVMYAHFARRTGEGLSQLNPWLAEHKVKQAGQVAEDLNHFNPGPEALKFLVPTPPKEKDSLDADFWG